MALNLLLEGKEQPSKEQGAATQAADIICRSHSSREKRGAHRAEATKSPCEIGRCVISGFEEPWGSLQRPGARNQELQNKPKKWSWSSIQKEDEKILALGKMWQAINAKRRVLLEDYICTQGQDRRADSDPVGCQQVSHFSSSRCKDFVNDSLSSLLRRSGCVFGGNNFSSCLR